jgi:hypothetical protein
MPNKNEIVALANRIRHAISEQGGLVLGHEELAQIWNHHHELPDMEKRLHLENFARQFGFATLIKSDLTSASFEKLY